MSEAFKWVELTTVQRDILIAQHVTKIQHEWAISIVKGNTLEETNSAPKYSTDMNAAWLVVEHFRNQRFDVHVASAPLQYDVLIASRRWEWKRFEASAESAPEAICLAALRAVGVEIVV